MKWMLRTAGLSAEEVGERLGMVPRDIQIKANTAVIGHAPHGADKGRISIFQYAALLVWKDVERLRSTELSTFEALLPLAAEAYIDCALRGLTEGMWTHSGGRPEDSAKLWSLLKSPIGKEMMRQQLAPNEIDAVRYAYLSQSEVFLTNETIQGPESFSCGWIDAHSIAEELRRHINGQPFKSIIVRDVPGVVNAGARVF
jgi:hypothetical protein